jgi:hypothetical protein
LGAVYEYSSSALLVSIVVGPPDNSVSAQTLSRNAASITGGKEMAINLDAPFVVLRASNGEFVCAEGGGGQEVVANRSQRGPWETFTFHHRTENGGQLGTGGGPGTPPSFDQVGFQVFDGMYISADGGGGGKLYANRGWWAAWETFDIFPAPDEIIAAHPGAWHLTN